MMFFDHIIAVYKHPCGGYSAVMDDGNSYGFRTDAEDQTPLHKALVAALADGTLKAMPAPPLDPAMVKMVLCSEVDAKAARLLKRPSADVTATRQAKLEEARALLEHVHHDGEQAISALSEDDQRAQYPLLSASLGLHGNTLLEIATLVHSKAIAERKFAYDVERARLHLKAAITAAATADDADAVFASAQWPGDRARSGPSGGAS